MTRLQAWFCTNIVLSKDNSGHPVMCLQVPLRSMFLVDYVIWPGMEASSCSQFNSTGRLSMKHRSIRHSNKWSTTHTCDVQVLVVVCCFVCLSTCPLRVCFPQIVPCDTLRKRTAWRLVWISLPSWDACRVWNCMHATSHTSIHTQIPMLESDWIELCQITGTKFDCSSALHIRTVHKFLPSQPLCDLCILPCHANTSTKHASLPTRYGMYILPRRLLFSEHVFVTTKGSWGPTAGWHTIRCDGL